MLKPFRLAGGRGDSALDGPGCEGVLGAKTPEVLGGGVTDLITELIVLQLSERGSSPSLFCFSTWGISELGGSSTSGGSGGYGGGLLTVSERDRYGVSLSPDEPGDGLGRAGERSSGCVMVDEGNGKVDDIRREMMLPPSGGGLPRASGSLRRNGDRS